MKTLLIGYGNSLRQDDGFGNFVARSLRKNRRYECLEVLQLTPELTPILAQFRKTIFVDINIDAPVGVFAVPLPKKEDIFAHAISPWSLVLAAQKLYGAKIDFLVFSVGGKAFRYDENLTPPLKEAALNLIAYLKTN
ncbi:MAG: hydrogenase maturation protease [Helicobacteraceae bacterium]|jgi:hydrogenase maturation protease|nr:hydrogenase maturation protease [Helicobacteraceae bacterium]